MVKSVLGAAALAVAVSSSAMAADLVVDVPAIVEPDLTYDWSGLYVGVHGGGLSGSTDAPYSSGVGNPLTDGDDPFDFSSYLVGAHVGVNVQQDSLFGGVELLGSYAPFSGDDDGAGGAVNGLEGEFLGTLAGRVGFASEGALFYLSGGAAVLTATGTAPGEDDDLTFWGGTVGVGAEFVLADNVSARFDYRYYAFEEQVASFPGGDYDIGYSPSFHTLTAGLSFGF